MAAIDERVLALLDSPAAAVLTTYRRDGSAVASPVWVERFGNELAVVVADDDVKLRHLAHRPECSLLVFESTPPFRGVRIEGVPAIRRDDVDKTRLAIASRYLGGKAGAAFTAARGSGAVLRFSLDGARVWDLGGILPAG